MTNVQRVSMYVLAILVGLYIGWWVVAATQSNAEGQADEWSECIDRAVAGEVSFASCE